MGDVALRCVEYSVHYDYLMYCFVCCVLHTMCICTSDTLLWRGMTGVHLAAKTAQKRLIAHFSGEERRVASSSSSALAVPPQITVCLVDELDYLITRNFEVMYHFYSWPMFRSSNFILIGIANTMDLPEKLSTRYNYSYLCMMRFLSDYYVHELWRLVELQCNGLTSVRPCTLNLCTR